MNKNKKRPVVLAILDGWGVGPKDKKINAIEAAGPSFFEKICEKFPYVELNATGEAVGLESDQMSGSEAGHLNIGAGRVVKQDVRTILEDINSGRFFYNPVFSSSVMQAKRNGSDIHLMGLMGNNDSPHSHPDVFLAILTLIKNYCLNSHNHIYFHFFTDGRDSFPKSALEHWQKWKKMIDKIGIGNLASITGRFYAMDRAKNWDRLLKAFEVITLGKGDVFQNIEEAVEFNYKKGNTDEYIEPAIISENGKPTGIVKNNDLVIFFNLRSDRARQFTKFFAGTQVKREKNFPSINYLKGIDFIAMTNFGPDLNVKTAYPTEPIKGTLPFVLSEKRQLYISETEKFAHVTYFFNGGYSRPIGGEDRIIINSPKVRSYADKPEMSANEIARVIMKNIKSEVYDFITVNFPNTDMVGHTGDFEAAVEAVKVVDEKIGAIYDELKKKNGILIVTADHGNADVMIDQASGRVHTFHTKNPVPFVIVGEDNDIKSIRLREGGVLADVAPTILDLMNIYKPEEMINESLIY
jgi:2,3-bisphosphoglycerate-independent phosphoglycerate mutase